MIDIRSVPLFSYNIVCEMLCEGCQYNLPGKLKDGVNFHYCNNNNEFMCLADKWRKNVYIHAILKEEEQEEIAKEKLCRNK